MLPSSAQPWQASRKGFPNYSHIPYVSTGRTMLGEVEERVQVQQRHLGEYLPVTSVDRYVYLKKKKKTIRIRNNLRITKWKLDCEIDAPLHRCLIGSVVAPIRIAYLEGTYCCGTGEQLAANSPCHAITSLRIRT